MNRTAIEWTVMSWNPVTGCEHGCWYCVDRNTEVFMVDTSFKKIKDLATGDKICGVKKGDTLYWEVIEATVLNKWASQKIAYEIILQDGRRLVCSADHKWLTNRSWKFVLGTEQGKDRRPHLTTNNKIYGLMPSNFVKPNETIDYKKGYLSGIIKGDGLLKQYYDSRLHRKHNKIFQFRLCMKDEEAIERTKNFLEEFGVFVYNFKFERGLFGIRRNTLDSFKKINEIISYSSSKEFLRGFVAGAYDAEGSLAKKAKTIRFYNTDFEYITKIKEALNLYDFAYLVSNSKKIQRKKMMVITLKANQKSKINFFLFFNPAIKRKKSFIGIKIKHSSKIMAINQLKEQKLYDVQTTSGNFLANGLIAHNCYAEKLYRRFKMDWKPTFHSERLQEPWKLKKPTKIFCCSVSDLFAPWTHKHWYYCTINAIEKCPVKHQFQLLTKQPDRIPKDHKFPDNVWIGATVNTQDEVWKIDEIKKVKCGIKFISFEPLLSEIKADLKGIDWVIVGKLTGSKKIPLDPEWVRGIASECRKNNIPLFIKNNVKWQEKVQEFPLEKNI